MDILILIVSDNKMSISLELGFREKPQNLDEFLEGNGFKLTKAARSDYDFDIKTYRGVTDPSRKGVSIYYNDGLYPDKKWVKPYPNIVATASVDTYKGRTDAQLQMQKVIAFALKNEYCAMLYDPANGEVID
jgi:hypothetical protein